MRVKNALFLNDSSERIIQKMESDSFLTVSNLKSGKHGSKTMETPLYPRATDGVRRLQQARYFTRTTTHHIPRRSFSEPARQYCKALLSFSFYITKPGALPLMKKTSRVFYTGCVEGGLGWGRWVMRERKGDDCC